MLRINSFKTKLALGGTLMAAVPLLAVLLMSWRTQESTAEVASVECASLGRKTLDHIAAGVYGMCQVEIAATGASDVPSLEAGSDALRQAIMDIEIGQTGYVFVLDSVGHYVVSKGGKRDGEVIWGAKDADGVLFIQEMIAKAKAAPRGEIAEQTYPWLNKGEDEARLKVSRVIYVPEWDWVIGAGAYLDEFQAAESQIRAAGARSMRAVAAVILFSVLVVAGLAWVGGSRLTAPLQRAAVMADAIAVGRLDGRLGLTQEDEVGTLGRALDSMADGLQEKADVAARIAEGDLTVTVEPHGPDDQFGQALRTMTDRLSETVSGIQQTAHQVRTGAAEISQSSTSLAQGATEQAAAVEEISSSMVELGAVVAQNADKAAEADRLTDEAKGAATEGVSRMSEMTAAMSEISSSSEEIAKIIKVIDDIAFQTNLLALNAAVEAARAGKHGKGFAVVAEEVRNLAGRSAKAARETSGLITGSQEKVHRGTDIAERTSASLAGILEGVEQASGLVGEIASASREQSAGINEVSDGLRQIDQVTQQASANSEETAAAGSELAGQATTLHELSSRFRLAGTPPAGDTAAVAALMDEVSLGG